MPRGAGRASALLGVGILVCACTGPAGDGSGEAARGTTTGPPSVGGASAAVGEYTGDDFYAVPEPLPDGRHGDLIRYQRHDGEPIAGGTRWRIMYLSEAVDGTPIAVTGTAAVPSAPAPPGGRATLSLAHGTAGIADRCAPSKGDEAGERQLATLGVERGYLVASTDYEGLGTPGRHPYLVGESEGRGVLDAVRAAGRLPGADPGGRLAIAGYSQGGHAALWAGQLAGEWTPELEVVGTFAGAPATELPVILAAAGDTPIAGFLYMIVAGFAAAYPDRADPSLLLTDAGLEALDVVDDGCVAEVVGRIAGMAGDDLLRPDPASVDDWVELMAENDPGQVATEAPVLVVHSAADDVVPAALSERMVERMCGVGQQVERRVLDDGQGHVEAAAPAFVDGLAWIDGRFAGAPAASTCP